MTCFVGLDVSQKLTAICAAADADREENRDPGKTTATSRRVLCGHPAWRCRLGVLCRRCSSASAPARSGTASPSLPPADRYAMAANCRAEWNCEGSVTAATIAEAVIGPLPGDAGQASARLVVLVPGQDRRADGSQGRWCHALGLVHEPDQRAGGPSQAVEVEHNQHVVAARVVKARLEAGPFGAGAAAAVIEDALAAGGPKCVQLTVEHLPPLPRRDPGAADQFHAARV